MTESEILYWLSLSGLSVKKQKEIIKVAASISDVEKIFIKSEKCKEIAGKRYTEMAYMLDGEYIRQSLLKLRAEGIFVATILNPLYPQSLKQAEVDGPLAFYYKGNLELLQDSCIAVVGTRSCTSYGKRMTEKFVPALAKAGFCIVSGLATGIDAYAHEAALDVGGRTIAVLGSGLNVVTPVSNAQLYDRILQNGGLIISEYKPNDNATKYTFPERNRIISGLSKGVLVVEASKKSGALITAEFALEQGRDVFAVPGNLDSTRSEGTNELIFNGAFMVRSGEDICQHYGVSSAKVVKETVKKLDNDQKRIYSLLEDGERSIDELVELSGVSPQELSSLLTDMEINGLIARTTADNYVITEC